MGFLSGMFSAAVKTVLTPVAVVKDVVNVATDQKPDATKKLHQSAIKDIKQATDELADGDVL